MIAVVPFAFIVGVAVASYISNNISLTRRTYCCCCCCCFCFLLLPSGICHLSCVLYRKSCTDLVSLDPLLQYRQSAK
jgi:hypothetical protein